MFLHYCKQQLSKSKWHTQTAVVEEEDKEGKKKVGEVMAMWMLW
jgi:hypothetical protein